MNLMALFQRLISLEERFARIEDAGNIEWIPPLRVDRIPGFGAAVGMDPIYETMLAVATSTISARTASIFGSGTANLYRLVDGAPLDTGFSVTAWNPKYNTIADGSLLLLNGSVNGNNNGPWYIVDVLDTVGDNFMGLTVGPITAVSTTLTTIATLSSGIDSGSTNGSGTTLPLSSVASLTEGEHYTLTIDNEDITGTLTGGAFIIGCRAADGSTATSHASASLVVRREIALGTGTVKIIQTTNRGTGRVLQDTCKSMTVWNDCAAIPDDTLVDLEPVTNSSGAVDWLARERCAVSVSDGSGSGSGSGSGDCPCADPPETVTFTLAGVTNVANPLTACTLCDDLNKVYSLPRGGVFFFATDCIWSTLAPQPCPSSLEHYVYFGYNATAAKWQLIFVNYAVGGLGGNEVIYQADSWDCSSDLALTLQTSPVPYCDNWPASITLSVEAGAGGAPTVSPNTGDLCQDAATITIAGTNFETAVPGNNKVTFNLGAVGTCTAATSTSLTVAFTTPPTTTGSLTAIVENANGSSAPAVQVATVITCSGGSITYTAMGTNYTASSSATISGITMPAGSLLLVYVACDHADQDITVTYDGTAMDFDESLIANDIAGSGASGWETTVLWLKVDQDTTGDIVITPNTGATKILSTVAKVTGLTNRATDVGASSGAHNSSPDFTYGPTTIAAEFAGACFLQLAPGITWIWDGTWTSTQQVNDGAGNYLTDGYRILAATESPHPIISSSSCTDWGGSGLSFS